MKTMATVTRLLTYEDWLAMPPAGEGREEVVNGELQILPPNDTDHAEIIHNISAAITPQVDRKRVLVMESNFNLLISLEPLRSRAPDLALCWREGMVRDEHRVLRSAPELIIEVLSPSENKRRKQGKLDDYARIGVSEVWIVSPEAGTIEIRTLRDGVLIADKIVAEGTIEPTRFPGVKVSVNEIWPDAE
jgi:Uma2 family endonuclease